MTDREMLAAMFARAGVVVDDSDTSIEVSANGDGPGNDGYPYFYTVFEFNEDGSLRSVGCWE